MKGDNYEFGMIGLGVMGRNLLLNMADHGFKVAGHDKDQSKLDALAKEAKVDNVRGFLSVNEFIESLRSPRAIMLLVPAGKIVDAVLAEIVPLLDKGDIIVDGGNSHYTDTNRRVGEMKAKGLHFFGMGISGGEEGARNGPSMMPGGDAEAYKVMRPIFEKVAAKVGGEPCVTYIGPGASGHFVKMVHNGIEYGIMQLITETYEIMRKGLKLRDEQMHELFISWSQGRLRSFLIEITRDILGYREPGSTSLLLNEIKDEARSKGTGKWTSQVAMDLQAPITVIDTAVSMRDLSKYKALRVSASKLYHSPAAPLSPDIVNQLEDALYFATIVAYAQGMQLLSEASAEFGYGLRLDRIARIWRGGCIIRSAFLEDIYQAYSSDAVLPHLLVDNNIQKTINELLPAARNVVAGAISSGIAMPAHTAAIAYLDSLRSERMPTNLIQAQRDFFGAHTYEKTGREGVFHTQWAGK